MSVAWNGLSRRHRLGGVVTCVWDLRRGDSDDNRSSPHGRGLRSMVVSFFLEFNYLAAPVAFLALIVGPALLVGIAPSLLLTYTHLIAPAWSAEKDCLSHWACLPLWVF